MQNQSSSRRGAARDPEAEIAGLASLFQALGDPARLRILNLLAQGGGLRNSEVEAVTGYGNSKISRHFAYLKHAGLVHDRRDGLSVHYALRPAAGLVSATLLQSLRGWAEVYALFERDAAALHAQRAGAGSETSSATGDDRWTGKPRVLFLCQHNAVRSQIAEAYLRRHGGERFEVHSAGLTSTEIHPFTLAVLREDGMPTEHLRSKSVTDFLGRKAFAWVITLCLEAEEACPRLFPGAAQIVNWPFEDVAAAALPEAERLAKFRLLRDSIAAKVREWLRE